MNGMKEKIRCDCLEKEAAPCVSACPFHFDAREFIPRVQRGAFNLAYRHYANSVAFPRIISEICDGRCRSACPRGELDSAVDLKELERAAVAHATRTAPNSYNMPAKNQRIAVIGAGLSGLSCALRLANKKYGVDVYEKSDRTGGALWNSLSPDIFLKDIEEQFSKEKYGLFLNSEITDIEELRARYDAVYIATGTGGETFGLAEGASGLSAVSDGVFIGGSVTGASLVEAAAHGLKAAALIEGFLKTGLTKGPELYVPTKIKLDLSRVEQAPGVVPSSAAGYSAEEATAEAARCISCKCDYCVRSCDMMAYFQKFPKLIEEEVHITINPGTLDGNGTVATRLISTCNQCGLCGKVCPEGIDVGLFMRESHRAMRAKSAMPWAFHEFWLNDMEFALSDKAAFFHVPRGCASPRYLFFPGCQMGASEPRYVTETYRLMRKICPDTAILVSCCGAPAVWSGDEDVSRRVRREILQKWESLGKPEFVFGCPTCRGMMGEEMPEIKGVMLSDFLFESGAQAGFADGTEISVFDPCAARNFPETQKNVRLLLERSGYKLVPLKYERETAKCCSWGGQISIANPPYTRWLVEKRVKDGELPYVVYCTNCRDIFADAGKPVLHILDLILGERNWNRRPPTYSKRRRNRELVKAELMREWEGREMETENYVKLFMTAEVEEKLNKSKILEDDVRDVINFCEKTGRKLLDPGTGHSLGYAEIGHMTCWAEYSCEGDGWRVHNAYSHRMKIELEEVWHGRRQKIDMQPL